MRATLTLGDMNRSPSPLHFLSGKLWRVLSEVFPLPSLLLWLGDLPHVRLFLRRPRSFPPTSTECYRMCVWFFAEDPPVHPVSASD